MIRVFIIHGWEADSGSNWFPWLEKELNDRGHEAKALDMPNSAHPEKKEWLESMSKEIKDEDAILVGHSLGVPAMLAYLENNKAGKAILVSGFDAPLGIADEPDSFVKDGFDFKKIKKNCPKFVIYHSDNDPYIPLDMAKNLNGELIILPNAGHINLGTGYFQFPEILKNIES